MGVGPGILRPVFAAWLSLGALLCAGCGGGAGAREASPSTGGMASARLIPDQATQRPSAPRGLEVVTWVVEDLDVDLALTLAPFERERSVLGPEMRRRWEESGLRVVAVPVERMHELRAALPPRGRVQRAWLGEVTEWRPAARGPLLGGGLIGVGGRAVEVPAGTPELLTRAWSVPRATASGPVGAELQIEIVPRVRHARTEPTLDQIEARLRGVPRRIEEEGPIFDALAVRLAAIEGMALVVVPEAPGFDWADLADRSEEVEARERPPERGPQEGPRAAEPLDWMIGPDPGVSMGMVGEPVAREGVPSRLAHPWEQREAAAGPRTPGVRTFGELMLSAPAVFEPTGGSSVGRLRRPARKVVLVLIPHVPDRFELLPRTRDGRPR